MEIVKIKYSDAVVVGKMLKNSKALVSNTIVKDILEHIKNGVALKFIDNNEILGIWCSKEFNTHVSLSFFYTDESIRKKPQVFVFFKTCMECINLDKPLIIKTKDTTGFDRYVKHLGNDMYQFIGLR